MAHIVIHGQVVQQCKLSVLQYTDAVSGANPDLAVDVLHLLDVPKRLDVNLPDVFKAVSHAPVVQHEICELSVYHPGFLRIGKHKAHATIYRTVFSSDIIEQPAVLKRHQVSTIGRAVDNAIAAQSYVPHISVNNELIFDNIQIILRIDRHDAICCSDIDRTALILADGTGVGGSHAVQLSPSSKLAALQHCYAIVVRANPQPIPAVHKETLDTG